MARRPIIISGWLKGGFRSISTTSGSSYGPGIICAKIHRMSVHVSTITPKVELKEGLKISAKGIVERCGDAFVLNTTSIDLISLIPGAPIMSEDDMDEAVESPPLGGKRAASTSEDSDLKKLKED